MIILLGYLSLWLNINSNIMDKKQKMSNSQEINEVRKPKRTFAQACKETRAIPLFQFEKELWDAFNEGYRKHGKH